MRKLAITGAAVMAALVLAAPASAETYLSRSAAKASTRDAVHELYDDNYGLHSIGVYCQPQYNVAYVRGYVYRRWVCTWVATDYEGDVAFGQLRIVGAPGYHYYTYKTLRGIHWR